MTSSHNLHELASIQHSIKLQPNRIIVSGDYTISKSAPLMPRHVTSSDVIDLKLHTNDGCLTINMCVNFEVIKKNFTTHIFKKSI